MGNGTDSRYAADETWAAESLMIFTASLRGGITATNCSKHTTNDATNDSFLFVNHPFLMVINTLRNFAPEKSNN